MAAGDKLSGSAQRRLITAIALGQPDALAAFYDQTSRFVYGLAITILNDTAVAESVTLDVYLRVRRDAARYRPEHGAPLAWLLALARSCIRERWRALRAELQANGAYQEALGAVGDLTPAAGDDEHARRVRDALAKLPPESREALLLAYFGGLSHGEIAERLATPTATVKARIRAGIRRLQVLLSA